MSSSFGMGKREATIEHLLAIETQKRFERVLAVLFMLLVKSRLCRIRGRLKTGRSVHDDTRAHLASVPSYKPIAMASSSKLVPADVMLLDQAALKVCTSYCRVHRVLELTFPPTRYISAVSRPADSQAPVDSLRRLHRTTQKTFEYNLGPASSFQRELDELIRRSNSASTEDVLELTKKIDALLAKMRGLKRKLTDLSTASDTATRTAQARLTHLSRLPPTLTHPSYPNWARKRLSHQLVDYCLRSTPPLKRTAEALAREEGIEDLVDQETWVMLGKVEGALRDNKLEDVLSWVGENRVALKKLKVGAGASRSISTGSVLILSTLALSVTARV